MSGFVYIWRDRKHNRYYIGSHWGSEDDGYICSSSWMKQAYRIRPLDFKRRILAIIKSNKKDLLVEENKWLQKIEIEEIGKKYYNLRNKTYEHWWATENKAKISQKISFSKRGKKGKPCSEEHKKKLRTLFTGRQISIEQRKKISETLKGKPTYKRTEEHNKASSIRMKSWLQENIHPKSGVKHSKETLELMSKHNAMNHKKYRDKVGDSNRGTKLLILNETRKMAKPGSEKWNVLIAAGFVLGSK